VASFPKIIDRQYLRTKGRTLVNDVGVLNVTYSLEMKGGTRLNG
jgi:hypothetical protein